MSAARRMVVGLGQPAAGDDGVGHAVLEELGRGGLPPGVELRALGDPLELVTLLGAGRHVVLVDAVLAAPPGAVRELGPEELATLAPGGTSSHGLGAAQALALARELVGPALPLRIVGITIERPGRYACALSPAVAAAVPVAARRVRALLRR